MEEQKYLDGSISREQIAALVEKHAGGALQKVEPLGTRTLRLNDEFVLQIEGPAKAPLAQMALLYRRLRAAEVPVPEVVTFDANPSAGEKPMLLTRYVPGVNGADVWRASDTVTREALSENLGRVVATIHALPWPGYGGWDVASARMGPYTRWLDVIIARMQRIVDTASGAPVLLQRLVDGVVADLNDSTWVMETASVPALCHTALDWSNTILEQTAAGWRIAALLGWEEALLADAAWEWASLTFRRDRLSPLPGWFQDGYKPRGIAQSDRRVRVHLYRLLLHLEEALAAYQAGDWEKSGYHEAALTKLLGAI